MASDPFERSRRPPQALWLGVGQLNETLLGGVSRATWRSITWSLEASRQLRQGSSSPGKITGWWGAWIEATRWWTEALAAGSRLGWEADSAILVELAAGMARAFRGRQVGFELRGVPVRAELDSISLDTRDGGYSGRLELGSADYDGLALEALSVSADDVALTTRPSVALVLSGVEVQGRSALAPIVSWLDPKLPEWSIGVAEGGLIRAVPCRGGTPVLVEATVRNDQLLVELRALCLKRATVRCPRWLRLNRRMALPPLGAGVLVTAARCRGATVEFRLSVATISHGLDLGRLRDAILSAGPGWLSVTALPGAR